MKILSKGICFPRKQQTHFKKKTEATHSCGLYLDQLELELVSSNQGWLGEAGGPVSCLIALDLAGAANSGSHRHAVRLLRSL